MKSYYRKPYITYTAYIFCFKLYHLKNIFRAINLIDSCFIKWGR